MAAADVEVVSSRERQRPQHYTQQLLLSAGGHTAAQGLLINMINILIYLFSTLSPWVCCCDLLLMIHLLTPHSWFTS